MQPKLLPSFVGKPPNQQKVEVWAQFLPELISFEQLKRLNNDPLMAGRTWIGEEAAPILTLLLAAPHFVGSLQFGLASLMQNGYFVAEDQAFCAWLD